MKFNTNPSVKSFSFFAQILNGVRYCFFKANNIKY